jgi:hypothetical protein
VNNGSDERRSMPSASSFARYEACPGSFQLETEARRIGQLAHQGGKDADRGTRIHAFLAGEQVELNEEERTTAENLKARADEQVRRIFDGVEFLELREKRIWLK